MDKPVDEAWVITKEEAAPSWAAGSLPVLKFWGPSGNPAVTNWFDDAWDALRFARLEDAERMKGLLDGYQPHPEKLYARHWSFAPRPVKVAIDIRCDDPDIAKYLVASIDRIAGAYYDTVNEKAVSVQITGKPYAD